MTKLGKYISNLLGKEEGPIYFDHDIEDFRYEKNDKEVYPEEVVKKPPEQLIKKPIHVQLQDLKEWSQNPKEYYAKQALKSYHQPTLPFKPEEIKPTKPKARKKYIPITIPERHYEAKKEKSFEEFYQDRKNNLKKQGLGRYETTRKR